MEDLRGQWSSKLPLFCIWAGTAKIQHRLSPPPGVQKTLQNTQEHTTLVLHQSTSVLPMTQWTHRRPQEATGAIGGLRVGVGLGVTCVCRSGTPLVPIGHHWPPSVPISHHQLAGPRQHLLPLLSLVSIFRQGVSINRQ